MTISNSPQPVSVTSYGGLVTTAIEEMLIVTTICRIQKQHSPTAIRVHKWDGNIIQIEGFLSPKPILTTIHKLNEHKKTLYFIPSLPNQG
jgi:hypothetical protein